MTQKNPPITDAEIVKNTDDQTPSNFTPALAFAAGLLTAVVGWYLYGVVTATAQTADNDAPAVVATIDGEEVSSVRYTQSLEQSLAFAAAQGADVTDPAIRADIEQQALTSVINTRLLVAAATEAGYSASDEAVDTQLANLVEQYGGEEALKAEVAAAGLTPETLRSDIAEQITVDEYLQAEVVGEAPTVTDEDIAAFYEELQAGGQELPPLADVSDAIAAQITQENEQNLVLAHIETLREAAEIETNI